ncbi:polymorphic toxin type 17 domain-containing protein [Actinomadura sp. K4S16]|uniref:polymorphic toxin type 17 domain-containing protein n=1 Tax=Actinomadura sp. K4S16 TaxID=1316147 RepID=UPI0011EE9244|nr:polymorphic toxin type 17 domain-containing protein [Actinomadura sp. K4S16]
MLLGGHGWARSKIALGMAAVLALGLASPMPARAESAPRRQFKDAKPVKGRALDARPRKAGNKRLTTKASPAPSWPKAGTATSKVPGKGRWARAGDLPVWVTAPSDAPRLDSRPGSRGLPAAEQVRVQVVDSKVSDRAGVQGVMISVARTDTAAPGQVGVGLNYASFASAFGGAYADRLKLVQYPACVLTTPERAECRTATPVATTHDTKNQTLIAQVRAESDPAARQASPQQPTATSGPTVLATAAGTAGEQGDFKATKLSASSTWNVNLNTGDFTWSYPMRVPPVPGTMAPEVAISYSSGNIDGLTSNTNAQSSWVGDGFDLWPGFIERRYKACEDDDAPKDEWGSSPGDQCWGYDNATMQLNGHGGELVPDGAGKWRLKNDDGTRVERLTGNDATTGNGDDDNEYWKVTTTDGTVYYFGKHRLDNWASGNPETNSTWTVPVFGDDANEPCHKDAFKDSWCQQAWRWNLDYAVDPDGNAVTYYYDKEINHYGRNLKPEDETPYVRGGVLNRIEYGLRSDNLWAKAPARVVFNSKERCLDTDANCDPSKIETNPNLWPDVPYDLNCKSGTECKDFKGTVSPTFWTRKRLESVKTQVIKADGTWRDVDSWTLTHKWGTADYARALLATSIQHTGHAASTAVTLPKVTLDYEERYNRVRAGDTGGLMRYRLDYVADESGGELSVAYSTAQCTSDDLPTPQTNTKRCFPVYWAHDGDLKPSLDWFHKYVVTHVIARDRTGHSADMVTKYIYDDSKGGAWHYDDDDGLTREKYKTWSQWRGYDKVSVLTGSDLADGMVAQTDHYFLRGMHGDRTSTTDPDQKRTVTVDNGDGGTVTDHDAFAGRELRTVQLDKPGGQILQWDQNLPVRFQTASKTRSWGTVTANIVATEYGRTFTPTGPGTWRKAEVRTSYDADTGRVNWVSDNGDLAVGDDDRCTRYTYADNTTAWIRNQVAQEEVTRGSCLWSGLDRRIHVLSGTRTYYDGTASAPKSAFKSISKGRVTYTERLVSHAAADGSDPTYQKLSAVTGFDGYGRPTAVSDAQDHVTTTAYTQTPGGTAPGLTTKIAVTKPAVTKEDGTSLQLSTSATLDPAWGSPIVKLDEAGGKTDLYYDALGRTIRVWLPNRSRTGGETASAEYTYQIAENAPVVVGTRTVTNSGALGTPSYAIYDGFLRARQTQEPGQNGGRLITDTLYDGRGLVAFTYNGYYNDQAGPTPSLFGPEMQGLVHSQTRYSYDGAGRKTREALLGGAGDGAEVYATAYAYGSDALGTWVKTTPPSGGTPTTTYADVRGRTIELRQHNTATPDGTDYISTKYEYDPADRKTKMVGPGGKTWEYRYDIRGRQTTTIDPDRGTTTAAFNDLDQVVSTTDSRGNAGKVFHEYDALGRKLRTYAANGDGDKGDLIALWGYDTVRAGQLTFASRKATGADGNTYEYKIRTDDYDNLNRPKRTTITVPNGAEGGGLDGSYQFNTAYNPDGTVQSTSLPAAGDLPAEVLTYTYDNENLGRPLTLTGNSQYVTGTSYTNINQVRGYVLAAGGKAVNVGYDYDPATRRLIHATVSREGIDGYARDAGYTYDDAGNVRQITDVTGHASTGGVTTDTQCFRYDLQRRLTDAWTQSTATCAASAATAEIGGPAPYRNAYTYNPDGNRTTEESWGAGPDGGVRQETRTYRYPGDAGVDPAYKGHQLAGYSQEVDGTSDTQNFTYTYDAGGNTTQRTDGSNTLQFSWDQQGEISKITDTAQGSTTFVYDADGNRLVRRDKSGTVLYLPGMELRLSNGAVTATRYYSFGPQAVAMRTGAGVTLLAGDHQNTAQLAIPAGDPSKLNQRRSTPFGEDRGAIVGIWPTAMDKGFVGGTKDNTGLTHLGAREYDPATGRFISVDPVLDPADPQQLNGYSYADNNPVTSADPSGLCPPDRCGKGVMNVGHKTPAKGGGCGLDCGDPYPQYNWPVWLNPRKAARVRQALAITSCRLQGGCGGSRNVLEGRTHNDPLFLKYASYGPSGICGAEDVICQVQKELIAQGFSPDIADDLGDDYCSFLHCNSPLEALASGRSIEWPWVKGASNTEMLENGLMLGRGRGKGGCNSFVPGTEVLMADGSRKAIEDVEVGDKVLATDPKTGKTRAEPVVDTIFGKGEKNLVQITIDTTGLRPFWPADEGLKKPASPLRPKRGVIIATDAHPFWVAGNLNEWVNAGDLKPGMWLRTNAGTYVQVTATKQWTAHHQRVHNLTIVDLHTYYVDAGTTPVLVHNAGCWSIKGRLRAAGPGDEFGLPSKGRIRYLPPEGYNPANPLPRGPSNGYVDRFGNEWTVGPSRTEGHPFEWDVQLSRTGREKIGWLSRDGRHVNVDPLGEVTHR